MMFRYGLRNALRVKQQLLPRFSSSGLTVVGGSREHVDVIENRLLNLFDNYGSSDYIGEPINIAEHSIQAMLCAKNGGESSEVQMAALLHDVSVFNTDFFLSYVKVFPSFPHIYTTSKAIYSIYSHIKLSFFTYVYNFKSLNNSQKVGHLLGLEAGFEPAMDGCGTVDHEGVGADFIRGLGLHENIAYLTQEHVSAKRYLCNRNPGYEEALTEASKTTLKHQGGAMSDEEASQAESDPRWQDVLTMRYIDEAAKDPDMKLPPLKDILRPLIEANLATVDSSTKVRNWLFTLFTYIYIYCQKKNSSFVFVFTFSQHIYLTSLLLLLLYIHKGQTTSFVKRTIEGME